MYETFSPEVQRVVKLAEQFAREYQQDYVGTEHVLLAIARAGDGFGGRILTDKGLSAAKVKEAIDKFIKESMEDTWVFGRLPGSPHYRNVIAQAIEHAQDCGSQKIRTEHLLLALLDEEDSVAWRSLQSLGLTAADVKQRISQHVAAEVSECQRD